MILSRVDPFHILVVEILLVYRMVLGNRGNMDDYRIYLELARRGIMDDITGFDHAGNYMYEPKPSPAAKRKVNKAIRYAQDIGLLEEFRPGVRKYKKMLTLTKDGLETLVHFYDVRASGIYYRR